MLSDNRWFSLAGLVLLLLILPQCSDNKSIDYVQEGWTLIEQNQYPSAEQAFRKALTVNPKNPEAYYGLGSVYSAMGRLEQAEEAYMKAVRLDPTHFEAHYGLGYTYEQMGKEKESKRHYAQYERLKKKMDSAREEVRKKL